MGTPNTPNIWELGAPKFWVQWEGIGKLQAIAMEFCTVTTLGPRDMFVRFQLNRPKIGELGAPNFGFWPQLTVVPDVRTDVRTITIASTDKIGRLIILIQRTIFILLSSR